MNLERWQKLEHAFYQAITIEPDFRKDHLDAIGRDDPSLFADLAPLIAGLDEANRFFSESLTSQMPRLVAALFGNPQVDLSTGIKVPESWLPANVALKEPQRVGNYLLLRSLGKGGMGQVFLALDEKGPIRRQVALKLIKSPRLTKSLLKHFESEQQALALMNHHHIVHAYEFGSTAENEPYFTMEYVEGMPITKFCDLHRLTIEQRLRLFMQACDGVGHAHQKGVMHRDLKPSNILVTGEPAAGIVKIIDFGIARDAVKNSTGSGLIDDLIGTPRYMCPEQILEGRSDTRGDIYALGSVLYELLCGLPASNIKSGQWHNLEELQELVRAERVVAPSRRISAEKGSLPPIEAGIGNRKLIRSIRGDLDAVALRALARNPKDRYSTAQALQQDLEAHLASRSVSAVKPTTRYLLGKYMRRHRLQVLAISVMSVALIGACIAFFSAHNSKVSLLKASLELKDLELARETTEGFLNELLVTSHPGMMGADFPFRDLLDRVEKKLNDPSTNEDELAASTSLRLGVTFTALGQYERAASLLTHAATIYEKLFGKPDKRSMKARYQLGKCLALKGETQNAVIKLEEVARDQAEVLDSSDPDLVYTRIVLAGAYLDQRNTREAEHLCQSVLLDLNQSDKEDPKTWLSAVTALANAWVKLKKYPQAAELYRQALDSQAAREIAGLPDILLIKHDLGLCLLKLDEFSEAERLFAEVIPARTTLLGPTHNFTLNSRRGLAIARFHLGKYDAAETEYREVLAQQIKDRPDDEDSQLTRSNLIVLLTECELFEEAGQELELLVAHYERPGAGRDWRGMAYHNLGENYMQMELPEFAVPALEHALQEKLDYNGEKASTTHLTMLTLGQALMSAHEYGEARSVLESTLALAERYQPDQDEKIALFRGVLGYCLAKTGKRSEGLTMMADSSQNLSGNRSYQDLIETYSSLVKAMD